MHTMQTWDSLVTRSARARVPQVQACVNKECVCVFALAPKEQALMDEECMCPCATYTWTRIVCVCVYVLVT